MTNYSVRFMWVGFMGNGSPVSQYGCPSSRWKVLLRIGCWQEAHRKQYTCQVCFKALMTSC